jgi:hypothetical protein
MMPPIVYAISFLRFSLLVAALVICTTLSAWAQLPFFPGAEGYGGSYSGTAPVSGWLSNGSVYHVTNLNDDGPGSFRNAFQQNSSNKIIVFDVAGTIELTSGKLDIKNLANYYIAGQTAPGPVTVYGDMTQLTHSSDKENRNVALRYLSFRKGTGDNSDSITFAGSGLGTNLILDHVSASWSEDEILSVANNNTNVTVQYTTIHDALVSNHAYGSLIRPRISSDVTFHHNLYANNASRQARFGTYNGELLTADFRNNVVYNFRDRASYTGGSSESDQERTDINYVGNYIVAGPGTNGTPNIAFSVDKNVTSRVYQSGNFIDPDDAPGGTPADGVLDGTDTGTAMFRISTPQTDQTLEFMATPFATPSVTAQTATDAYNQIVNYVGNYWWARDAIDARVISNVSNFTGVPLGASEPIASELSGLLAAPMTSHAAGYDVDNDGMADAWETLHGGDLVWNADFDNDGYINLIDFVNEKGEFPAPAPIVFHGGLNNRYAHTMNWKTDDGGITAGSNWQPSKYDLAVIDSGSVVVDAVGQHARVLQIAPTSGTSATLSIHSGWLNVVEALEVGSTTGDGTLEVGAMGTLFAPIVTVGAMGEVIGEGKIVGNVVSEGSFSLGESTGTLDISGNFAQNAGGIVTMEIASTSDFDQLIIGGALMAGGTLDVDLLSFRPEEGDFFDLLDFSTAIGAFTLDLPGLTSGLAWDDSSLLITGELSVVASVLENADFDDDGDVDGQDFLTWQRGDGSAGSSADGDANNDGNVDAVDLGIWKTQYGTVESLAFGQSVPEPVSVTLITCCLLGISTWRPRR